MEYRTVSQLSKSQLDRQSLEKCGEEAVALLQDGHFQALADRFGYALAHGREPADAIATDLAATLAEAPGSSESVAPSIEVKYFNGVAAESSGLVATVECTTCLRDGLAVLLALVVTEKGLERYITLEGIDRIR